MPTYLRTQEGFGTVAVSIAAILLQIDSWAGFMVGGVTMDAIGRKRSFLLFAILGGVITWAYIAIPLVGPPLAIAGIALGFAVSGVVAGLGAYLSELFPVEIRGIGQGTTYSLGRALAAVPIAVVGDLAGGVGIGNAIAFSAVLFVLCLIALLILPETKGATL